MGRVILRPKIISGVENGAGIRRKIHAILGPDKLDPSREFREGGSTATWLSKLRTQGKEILVAVKFWKGRTSIVGADNAAAIHNNYLLLRRLRDSGWIRTLGVPRLYASFVETFYDQIIEFPADRLIDPAGGGTPFKNQLLILDDISLGGVRTLKDPPCLMNEIGPGTITRIDGDIAAIADRMELEENGRAVQEMLLLYALIRIEYEGKVEFAIADIDKVGPIANTNNVERIAGEFGIQVCEIEQE